MNRYEDILFTLPRFEFLRRAKIEELARGLGAENQDQIEALVKAIRVETARSEPNQGRIHALLVSMKTIAETFVGGAATNLATSTIHPAKAPAIIELAQHLLSHWQ
jgi:hypothetical protein